MRNATQQPEARKVLLIEGHSHVRIPLEHLLISRGHQITAVGSGEDGLKAIANGYYDTVVCNYHLPGMSGFEFFTASHHILSDRTTILTAALADNCMANNALELGITVFMEMPFKIDNLLACIEGRTPELCAGALGRHLYITSGGQMIAISPTRFDECTVPTRPSNAPFPKAINLSGRRWKLYINPDASKGTSNATGNAPPKNRTRTRNESGNPLYDLC